MKLRKSLSIALTIALFALALPGAEVQIGQWLVTQVKVFHPPFTSPTLTALDSTGVKMDALWPKEGALLPWDPNQAPAWKKSTVEGGRLNLPPLGQEALVFAATYLDVPRWQKGSLVLNCRFPFQVYFDGALVGAICRIDLTLTRGRHRLVVLSLQTKSEIWQMDASFQPEGSYQVSPQISIDPAHHLTLSEAMTMPQASAVEVSPDGSLAGILDEEGGIKIYDLAASKILDTIGMNGTIVSFSFSPEGQRLAVVVIGEQGKGDLWLVDRKERGTKKLLSQVEGMSQVNWLPDGKFVTYITRQSSQEAKPYDLVDNFFDRWKGWKTKVQLWIASVESGASHLVSGGPSAYGFCQQALVSPDGKKVAFVYETPSSNYPYSNQELWLTDLLIGEAQLVSKIKTAMISGMCWSPDSSQLAVIAPYYDIPLKATDPVHSRWHQGLQLWDISKKNFRYLTKPEFTPSLPELFSGNPLWWSSKNNMLYFLALDRTVHRLYKFSPEFKDLAEVKLPFTNIESLYGGAASNRAVLRVTAVDKPAELVSLDLDTLKVAEIWDRGKEFLSPVNLGRYEMFYCQNRNGTKIDGWLYFPPDFDLQKKYPLIVAYYGGVAPQTQSFSGLQYPGINHWLAGLGYVVYTLTPRGTWGYGQEFADAHLNEWGTASATDIIDAVKALVKAKSYLDPKKIGGFGASYGGFEGMSLITQTDLFAAVIASSGISNTLLYSFVVLGQPNMGEIVLPGAYPWNRRDIYVDRSPVFNADKVKTPLLLMHGTVDPWCLMAESDQMYSALKVQGKDVVEIRWNGEPHGVTKFSNRVLNFQIMLDWFDKYLRDEPEAWQERYQATRK